MLTTKEKMKEMRKQMDRMEQMLQSIGAVSEPERVKLRLVKKKSDRINIYHKKN